MEIGNSDDRVYAAERIMKKRIKKVIDGKTIMDAGKLISQLCVFCLLIFRVKLNTG